MKIEELCFDEPDSYKEECSSCPHYEYDIQECGRGMEKCIYRNRVGNLYDDMEYSVKGRKK